jgi:hypothetical protein
MTAWISTEDRMPEKDGRYIVYEKYNSMSWVGVSALRGGSFDVASTTHWMSLPEAPLTDKQ